MAAGSCQLCCQHSWGVLLPWLREERTTSGPQERRESPAGGGWGWDRVGRSVPTQSQPWGWDGHGEGTPAASPCHPQHHCHVRGASLVLSSRKAGFRALGLPPGPLDVLSWIPAHQTHLSSALRGSFRSLGGSGGSRSSGGIPALVTWPPLLGIPLMPNAINCKFLTHKAKRKRQDWDSGESPRDTARAAPQWVYGVVTQGWQGGVSPGDKIISSTTSF